MLQFQNTEEKMKFIFAFIFAFSLTGSAIADVQEDANIELQLMNERGWHHVGCVNQSNAVSTCSRKAAKKGFSHSRVQQDYLCNPRVFLSCYGKAESSAEMLSDEVESYGFCGDYVKPATCESHSECKWNGSCVPR